RSRSTTRVPDGGGMSAAVSAGVATGWRRQDAIVASSAPAAAARARLRRMALKDGLIAEYDHEVATTRKLIERVPDDKLAWKPHPKSTSIGGRAPQIPNHPNKCSHICGPTRRARAHRAP